MSLSQNILEQPKIAAWKKNIIDSGCSIDHIEPLSIYLKKNGEMLFALLHAEIQTPEGKPLPPIIFIRGNACIIVPLLRNSETNEEKFLMVTQRRIATGYAVLEFPAGMIDHQTDDPVAVALKELEEETGLTISRQTLHSLSSHALYSSPGACDESIYYYGCIIQCDTQTLRTLDKQIREQPAEHEYIEVTLKTKQEALQQLTSLQGRLGLYLFEDHFSKIDTK